MCKFVSARLGALNVHLYYFVVAVVVCFFFGSCSTSKVLGLRCRRENCRGFASLYCLACAIDPSKCMISVHGRGIQGGITLKGIERRASPRTPLVLRRHAAIKRLFLLRTLYSWLLILTNTRDQFQSVLLLTCGTTCVKGHGD